MVLFDANTGEQVSEPSPPIDGPIENITYNPTGDTILASASERVLQLDGRTAELLQLISPATDAIESLSIADDGNSVLIGTRSGALHLWDPRRNVEIRRFEGHTAAVRSIDVIPDRDGDNRLLFDELPQRYVLTVSSAMNSILPVLGTSRVAGGDRRQAREPQAQDRDVLVKPRWFLRMDRNADGDVSRREFLGTAEQFDAFDTNNDLLIDWEEAAVAGSP